MFACSDTRTKHEENSVIADAETFLEPSIYAVNVGNKQIYGQRTSKMFDS